MGHVTVDRLETAWKKLNKAKHLAENSETHGAVLECENALQEMYRSADGMGYGPWFTGREDTVRTELATLKNTTSPEYDEVMALIESCRELTKQTKKKVIPELHSRIDYEPTPTFRNPD